MSRKVTGAQHISRMCVVCGTENQWGFKARFLELEGGEIMGEFEPREYYQGYPGRLHGGLASTFLDETIGRAVSINEPQTWGVTVELTVRFKQPVPLDAPIRAVARITRDTRRIFEGTGEIRLPDGSVAIEASGKYMKLPIEQIAEGDFAREWFPDERELPESVEI